MYVCMYGGSTWLNGQVLDSLSKDPGFGVLGKDTPEPQPGFGKTQGKHE